MHCQWKRQQFSQLRATFWQDLEECSLKCCQNVACNCCLSRLQSHIPLRKGDTATRDGTERYVAFTGKMVIGHHLRKEEVHCAETHPAQRRHHLRKHPDSFFTRLARAVFLQSATVGETDGPVHVVTRKSRKTNLHATCERLSGAFLHCPARSYCTIEILVGWLSWDGFQDFIYRYLSFSDGLLSCSFTFKMTWCKSQ